MLGDKKGGREKVFDNFSNGLKTQRDSWCYNASATAVAANMERMIAFYNSEIQRFQSICHGLDRNERESKIESFINTDPTKISWTLNIKQELVKEHELAFDGSQLTRSLYRPFTKQWL